MKYLWILYLATCTDGLRILSVLPTPTKSHYFTGRRIVMELLRKGHEVVSVSPFQETMENLTWIEVEVKSMFEAVPQLKETFGQDYSFFAYQRYVWSTMNAYAKYITKRPKLATFLRNDTSKFDVIFAHDFFLPIFYVLAYKYSAPLVVISTFGHAHYIEDYMGNQIDYASPHEFSSLKQPLNFYEMLKNYCYIHYDIIGRYFFLHQYQNGLVEDVYGIDSPSLDVLERCIDVVLLNSHYSTSFVKTLSPNIVEVGGVHVEKAKVLNKELQEILDGADNEAILLSLGSCVELGSQKEEFVAKFFQVLSNLQQRVIIKWNSDRNLSEFKNFYTFSWLPQNDILAHPKLLLFLTHGGVLSNHEAVVNGVPIICIPFQANQHMVCQASEESGYGIYVPKEDVTVQSLNMSIQRILTHNIFKKNALEVSRRFQDRPISALDSAVFWIEYCARNKGFFKKNTKNVGSCSWCVWVLPVLVISLLRVVRWRNKCLPKFKVS